MRFTRLLFCALFSCASFVSLHAQSTTTATVLRPYITSIFPQSLLTGVDSTVLTINGKRFQRGAAVYFNARKLTNVRIDGDSVIVVVIPGELTVNADMAVLLVENPDETKIGMRVWVRHVCDFEFAIYGVSITPNITSATMQAFRLTASNTTAQDFKPNAQLFLNGSPLPIIRNDGRTLIADVPAVLNTAGTYALQLRPENVCFSRPYIITNGPIITDVRPIRIEGGVTRTFTITGINFISGAQVFLGNELLIITTISTTQIVVYAPSTLSAGLHQLTVINPNGGQAILRSLIYTSVGISESQTTISPNPVTTALTLETTLDRAATLTLTLRNILGEAVLQERHTTASGRFTATLDVSTLANGVYLLEMSDGTGGRWVQKVVKY